MKRDPFLVVGLVVAASLVTLLALFDPETAPIPVGVVGGILLFVTHKASGRRQARRMQPCQQCGRRFRGADMVEHHVNEHRECAS